MPSIYVGDPPKSFRFENFTHPFVGKLIQLLNQAPSTTWPVAWALNPKTLSSPQFTNAFFATEYSDLQDVLRPYPADDIDVGIGGPYANYNWELMYHLPVAVAVHLSKNQRFAEAQKWFHLVFDPTTTDTSNAPQRYWNFLGFRPPSDPNDPNSLANVNDLGSLLLLLSTPDRDLDQAHQALKNLVNSAYTAIEEHPFNPHLVARTRPIAYQWYVVMKYLDNLIAWGDSLFANPTIETVNEATLCYVLAANLLGPRPQPVPSQGSKVGMTYAQLQKAAKLGQMDPMGNAIVELESQFPFNVPDGAPNGNGAPNPLFGICRTLYFCVPQNPKLLGYWEIVADRLFKIRHCQNLQGAVQPLPLFDPPLDPGMLAKAMAAGVDVGTAVSGLNQPVGPVRSLTRIQKALELCSEVRSLGNTLLSAFEKGDAEQLAQLRQLHESTLLGLTENIKFLQWKQAEQATRILLATRATTLERYTFYIRLLGLTPDKTAPQTLDLDQTELTSDNWDTNYQKLVGEYDQGVTLQPYPQLQLASAPSPSVQSGASGAGQLYLNGSEHVELNYHMPVSRDTQLASSVIDTIASFLVFVPDFSAHLQVLGVGPSVDVGGGRTFSEALKLAADILRTISQWHTAQGLLAGKNAGYQRRADDWLLQANLAARELAQIGRQVIGSLIAEQVAMHEYQSAKTQNAQASDIGNFLIGQTVTGQPDGTGPSFTKFTTADLYSWMQGELTSLYYQYYRLALDAARKAEQTVKRELMRPELDATTYIQPNYWASGRQGLVSGDALHLDLKRLEGAYIDYNKRELELTCNISLRQLDPVALLALKLQGACTVRIPESYYDRSCPGHYFRRIKSVSVSIPSVVGPYTSVNCVLTLQTSTVRTSALPNPNPAAGNDRYARDTIGSDPRFVDYYGSVESIVTSSGNSDSGLFETNLHDDRFLPFEGAGAVSTWRLALPPRALPTFDYNTISDVILHVRYTARDGGQALATSATSSVTNQLKTQARALTLLFSLRYDFSTEWSVFTSTRANNNPPPFMFTLRKAYFPFMVQGFSVEVDGLVLYGADMQPSALNPQPDTSGLNGPSASVDVSIPADQVPAGSDVFLIIAYHLQNIGG